MKLTTPESRSRNRDLQQVNRTGVASRLGILMAGSLAAMLGLAWLALQIRPDAVRSPADQRMVKVYCAAGVSGPLQQMADQYNRQYAAHISIVRTGGSGELAGQIRTEFESGVTGGADLLVTADVELLNSAHASGVIAERFALAEQSPVIAVSVDRDTSIDGLAAMVADPSIRFGIASSRAAVGKLARQVAQREGLLESLESRKSTEAENVMTLAQALAAGSLDAAIIWDSTVRLVNAGNGKPVLKIAAFADPSRKLKSEIGIGVVAATPVPTECLKFARYLTAPETGMTAFEENGFAFIPGDRWEEVPEIHLDCGSMFTPVLERATRAFADREGVNLYSRWEGCGKLVASMRATEDPDLFPDAYLACDQIFLDEVADLFRDPIVISSNEIVMACRQSIAGQIQSPRDLLTAEYRIGICDPDLSALGRLTKMVLEQPPYEQVYQQLQQQVAVTVDVGPTLISQLAAGGLDVAFVYRSNVMADPDAMSALVMKPLDPTARRRMAIQPWAISRSTSNPELMQRYFEWINRASVKADFEKYGFEKR